MKTAKEWYELWGRMFDSSEEKDVEFFRQMQRDAWEQGVKDGRHTQLLRCEPFFPGSLKPEAKLREPNPGDNDSVFEWAYPPKERP